MAALLHQLQIDKPTEYKQAVEYGKEIIKVAKELSLPKFCSTWEICPYKEYMQWYISQAFRTVLQKRSILLIFYIIDVVKPDFKNSLYFGTTHFFIWSNKDNAVIAGSDEYKILEKMLSIFDTNEQEYANKNTPLHIAIHTKQIAIAELLLSIYNHRK